MPAALTFTDKTTDLAALGVPAPVLQYIQTQSYPATYRSLYIANLLAMLVTILGIPGVAGLTLFRISARLAAYHANQGILAVENHGWSAFPLCFGLLFLAGPLTQLWIRGRFAEYSAVRGLLQSGETRGAAGAITRWMLRKASERVPSGDPSAFLHEQGRLISRWCVWPGSVLTLIGLAVAPVDLERYDVLNAAGITRHTVFSVTSAPWDSLDHVETGCHLYTDSAGVERGSASYYLVFKDGETTSLPVGPAASSIEPLRRIDDLLRARQLPFKLRLRNFGQNQGTPLWDDGCVDRVASALGVDDQTIATLLRTRTTP